MGSIKNYTSKTPNTIEKIQKILAQHKAKRMMFEYDQQGRIDSLMFSIELDGKELAFRLPAKVKNVEKIFLDNKSGKRHDWELTQEEREQAYRTAWANIRDWVDAQLALIDTEQVKFEEVFLPYMVTHDGRTYFERQKEEGFLLGDGNN